MFSSMASEKHIVVMNLNPPKTIYIALVYIMLVHLYYSAGDIIDGQKKSKWPS